MSIRLLAAILVAGVAAVTPAVPRAAAAGAQWHLLRQAVAGESLTSIACPGLGTCYAAGNVVLRTRNAGATWDVLVARVPGGSAGIACPDTTMCYTTTAFGYLLVTRDGGGTWARQHLSSRPLGPIACPALQVCYTVAFSRKPGQLDIVLVTRDGGRHWTRHGLSISRDLPALACPSKETCHLVGGGYTVDTADGGNYWTVRNKGTDSGMGTDGSEFTGIACPASRVCYLVSAAYGREWTGGSIYRTPDGGKHWAAVYQKVGSSGEDGLRGIACIDARTCYVVGDAGRILHTADAGSRWSKQTSSVGTNFSAVTCARSGPCYAVGSSGIIVSDAFCSVIAPQSGGVAAAMRRIPIFRTWKRLVVPVTKKYESFP